MNRLKEVQMNYIILEASKLFLKKPIVSVTMSDIAKEIDIGEATLYRYFGKKQNLVIKVAEYLAKNVYETYFKTIKSQTGYLEIKDFFETYLKIYKENKNYYLFIYSLDAYLHSEKDFDSTSYSENISFFKNQFFSSYNKALKDKSIDETIDIDLFYRTTTISLLALCKKLSNENILKEDQNCDEVKQIQTLINIFLYRLNREGEK